MVRRSLKIRPWAVRWERRPELPSATELNTYLSFLHRSEPGGDPLFSELGFKTGFDLSLKQKNTKHWAESHINLVTSLRSKTTIKVIEWELCTAKLSPNPCRLPDKLVKVLDRDLKLAGISKRDERGRTIDVHAMQHTFGALLSKGGVAPRTAQAAMRHAKIDLTMSFYTDLKVLDVAGALDARQLLPLDGPSADCQEQRAKGRMAIAEIWLHHWLHQMALNAANRN